MKYVVMLGDGMADWSVPELDGKTPLQVAKKPNMDYLAQNGDTGLAITVPEGMPPGSDTANLSVMGYNPKVYYSGRSPLEAVSIGIDLQLTDVTFRCNLVNVSDDENYQDKTMIDYSSDEISTQEADELIKFLKQHFDNDTITLFTGISYRHCLVLKNAKTGTDCTPPHDITLKPVKGNLPTGIYGDMLYDIMVKSYDLLKDHPVNLNRIKQGKKPANSVWFWGEGTKPNLTSFKELYNVEGSVISAVDLIKGIGMCCGLESIDVEGTTGNIDTNFEGKAKAAIDTLSSGKQFVYIHVEAPDECGHRHEVENKVKAIELIDQKILGPVMKYLENCGEDYAILLTPDHPTPLEIRTHCRDAVPFAIYRSNKTASHPAKAYTEEFAKETGYFIDEGYKLMETLINQN